MIVFLLGLAVMLFLMVKTKLGPFMSMLLGGLVTSMGCGVGSSETVNALTGGFGNTYESIGLVTIFGTILGTCLKRPNSCQRIMTLLLKVTDEKNVSIALAVAGYLVSISIFSDIVLIALSPIIKAASKKAGKVLYVFATLAACALLCTSAYVAPTPAPLTVAAAIRLDVGTSIACDLMVAAILTVTAGLFCMLFLDKKPADYFTSTDGTGKKEAVAASMEESQMPSFIEAILSILVLIVLIVVNSVCGMVLAKGSSALASTGFARDRNIALIIDIISAILLLKKELPEGETSGTIENMLKIAGPVVFVTATGGALTKVMNATGAGQMFADALAVSFLLVILIPFLITALSKFAQGSGSVAALPGASLSIPLIEAGLMNPITAFIPISAGSHCGSHASNGFFWVFAEFFGYSTKTTLKTLCIAQDMVLAGIGLLYAWVISVI